MSSTTDIKRGLSVMFRAEGAGGLERAVRGVDRALDNSARKATKVGKEGKAGFTTAQAGVVTFSAKLASAKMAIDAVVRAAKEVYRIGKAFADVAMEAEHSFAQIRTLTSQAGVGLERDLVGLATKVPQTIAQINKAAYDAISAGVDASQVTEFLESSSQLALAGATDLVTTTSLLVGVGNAFQGVGMTTARASDVLFAAVKVGKLVMSDFERGMAKVSQVASQAGVSLEESTAAVAALTRAGVPARQAFTQVARVLDALIKPTKKSRKEFDRLGIEYGAAALKAKGLAGMLEEIEGKTGGNADSIAKLTGSVRSYKGLLTLTADDMALFNESLHATTNSYGAAKEAADIMLETTKNQVTLVKAQVEALMKEIGQTMLPGIRAVGEEISAFLDENKEEIKKVAEVIGAVFETLWSTIGLTVRVIRIAVATMFKPVVLAIAFVAKEVLGFSGIMDIVKRGFQELTKLLNLASATIDGVGWVLSKVFGTIMDLAKKGVSELTQQIRANKTLMWLWEAAIESVAGFVKDAKEEFVVFEATLADWGSSATKWITEVGIDIGIMNEKREGVGMLARAFRDMVPDQVRAQQYVELMEDLNTAGKALTDTYTEVGKVLTKIEEKGIGDAKLAELEMAKLRDQAAKERWEAGKEDRERRKRAREKELKERGDTLKRELRQSIDAAWELELAKDRIRKRFAEAEAEGIRKAAALRLDMDKKIHAEVLNAIQDRMTLSDANKAGLDASLEGLAALESALKEAGVGATVVEAALMLARGIKAGADAADFAAESIAAFSVGNVFTGAGMAAAAAAKGISSAAYFKGLSDIGGGGGGGGSGPTAAPPSSVSGGVATAAPTTSGFGDSERSTQAVTVNVNFTGPASGLGRYLVSEINSSTQRRGSNRLNPTAVRR